MSQDETAYVEITEDGMVRPTDEAPDEFVEWFRENQREVKCVVEFGMLLHAAGHDPDRDPHEYRDLADYHYAKQDAAVERGDIEAAQEHQEFAHSFERVGKEYFEVIADE